MANKKKWRGGDKLEGAPPIGKLMKTVRAGRLKAGAMTMQEKLTALELYAELGNIEAVATKLNRNPVMLSSFLNRYRSTTTAARMTLEAGSEILAKRIVKDANVEEALEVMDRLDILAAKRDKSAPQTTSVLVIGMPGHKDLNQAVPVPSQHQIQAAIDIQATRSE